MVCFPGAPAYTSGVQKERQSWVLPTILLVVFALTRWPGVMPPNFSAAYALVFCAAIYFPGRLGWFLPIGILLLSDVIMNTFYYGVSTFTLFTLGNYVAYAAIVYLGQRCFTHRSSFARLITGGFLSALIFYLLTNTFSWLHNPQYPKTLAGLIQALTIGTPGWPHTWEFFRNSLLSGGLFAGLFAGAMKLSELPEPKEEEAESEQPAEGAEESKA